MPWDTRSWKVACLWHRAADTGCMESAMDLRRTRQVGLEPFRNSLKTRLPRGHLGWLGCRRVRNTQCWNISSSCLPCSEPSNHHCMRALKLTRGFFFFYWWEVLIHKKPSCVLFYLFIHLFIYRLSIFSASYLMSTHQGAFWTFSPRPNAAMVFLLSRTTHLRTVSDLRLCCRCTGSSVMKAARAPCGRGPDLRSHSQATHWGRWWKG